MAIDPFETAISARCGAAVGESRATRYADRQMRKQWEIRHDEYGILHPARRWSICSSSACISCSIRCTTVKPSLQMRGKATVVLLPADGGFNCIDELFGGACHGSVANLAVASEIRPCLVMVNSSNLDCRVPRISGCDLEVPYRHLACGMISEDYRAGRPWCLLAKTLLGYPERCGYCNRSMWTDLAQVCSGHHAVPLALAFFVWMVWMVWWCCCRRCCCCCRSLLLPVEVEAGMM